MKNNKEQLREELLQQVWSILVDLDNPKKDIWVSKSMKKMEEVLAQNTIEKQIIKLVQSIMNHGDMVVETFNEAVLVKLMELNKTPIKYVKSNRDIEKDWEQYKANDLEQKKSKI